MAKHLDTAPIWASYEQGGECPLCSLHEENEKAYVESFLGGSVMEPSVRLEVNEKGFCARHFSLLYEGGNRLGLALMAQTRLATVLERLGAGEVSGSAGAVRGFWGKKKPRPGVEPLRPGCVICDRLENTMARYMETLLWLWGKDPAFRRVFDASGGLCLAHYAQARTLAEETLPAKERDAFLAALDALEKRNLTKLAEDLAGFTEKFDYRNAQKPWGESRDALPRAIQKLGGNP